MGDASSTEGAGADTATLTWSPLAEIDSAAVPEDDSGAVAELTPADGEPTSTGPEKVQPDPLRPDPAGAFMRRWSANEMQARTRLGGRGEGVRGYGRGRGAG